METEGQLRIWWHRRYSDTVAHTAHIPVISVDEAIRGLEILALSEVNDETVYLNAGGLLVFEAGEWVEWYSEDGESIDEYATRLEEEAAQ